MLAALPQWPGPQRGPQMPQLGRAQSLGEKRPPWPGAAPWLETGRSVETGCLWPGAEPVLEQGLRGHLKPE